MTLVKLARGCHLQFSRTLMSAVRYLIQTSVQYPTHLQFSRTLTSAETQDSNRSGSPETERSFNSAALLRVRKHGVARDHPGRGVRASIQPHSYECGNGFV
jgi:hypothetical protein